MSTPDFMKILEVKRYSKNTIESYVSVVRGLTGLFEWRSNPEVIYIDNGPGFTSATFEAWAGKYKIKFSWEFYGRLCRYSTWNY